MTNSDMTVIEMREPGGPEVLRLARREIPVPGPSEVLIKVAAAGINGPDLVQRRGHYPPPKGASDLLGLEVAGEIVASGSEQSLWSTGETVCALTNGGGYAEFVTVEASHCMPIPEGMSVTDAAGLPEAYFTVWSNVFHGQTISEGATFLVHGGSGGIGSTAIQIGSALGLTVITTAGSDAACDFCLGIGAQRAINFHTEDFVSVTRNAGGADIVLDIIGGDYIARNIKACRHDARIIQLAFNKGSKVEIDLMPVMLKRLTYTGSTLRTRSDSFKSEIASALVERVWPYFADGTIRPLTFKTLPLAEAAEGHRLMEAAQHHGKIVLIP